MPPLMLHPADVKQPEVAVADTQGLRFLAIRLVAVVYGEKFGYDVMMSVAVPRHLVGVSELGGLEWEMAADGPARWPLHALLERDPV